MRDIGKNIKTLRQKRDITQEELAEKLFVTRQTVSNYEIGRTRPDIDMLMKMTEVLEADMNELLYGPPERANRVRDIVISCVSVAITIVLVLVYSRAADWAWMQKSAYYNTTPNLLVQIYLKPLLLFASGWTALQLIGTFFRLQPLAKKPARGMLICALVLIVGYLLAVVPLTVCALSNWTYFNGWPLHISYFVLGFFPQQPLPDLSLLLSFLAGAMLWLAGLCSRSAKTS